MTGNYYISITPDTQFTDAEIKSIVHRFYERVRDDDVLGPVFEAEMKETWEKHLEKMCDFWKTVMTGEERYHGNPLMVHAGVPKISTAHFERWLGLFRETLDEVCKENSHVTAFASKANNMANAMTRALRLQPPTKRA